MRHDYSACRTPTNHIILLFEPVAQSGSHVADNWRLRDWQMSFRTLVWKPEGLGDLGPDPSGRSEGVFLRPLAWWNCRLECRGGMDICLVNIVCCHVRGPCDWQTLRPEESYRVCVCVCHWMWSGTTVTLYTYKEYRDFGQTKNRHRRRWRVNENAS